MTSYLSYWVGFLIKCRPLPLSSIGSWLECEKGVAMEQLQHEVLVGFGFIHMSPASLATESFFFCPSSVCLDASVPLLSRVHSSPALIRRRWSTNCGVMTSLKMFPSQPFGLLDIMSAARDMHFKFSIGLFQQKRGICQMKPCKII